MHHSAGLCALLEQAGRPAADAEAFVAALGRGWQTQPLDPVEQSMLAYAHKLTTRPGETGPGLHGRAPEHPRWIAAEHLGHIFDRFYRVEPSRARSRGGAGLGLTIAKLLAELQGGRIDVASQPGRGSAFTLWLPSAD